MTRGSTSRLTVIRCSNGTIKIPFRGGRIDATEAGPPGVPKPEEDLKTHTATFAKNGFNVTEMIGLVACGHSIGGVHHTNFPEIAPDLHDPVRQAPSLTRSRQSAFQGSSMVDFGVWLMRSLQNNLDSVNAFDSTSTKMDNVMFVATPCPIASRHEPTQACGCHDSQSNEAIAALVRKNLSPTPPKMSLLSVQMRRRDPISGSSMLTEAS